MDTEEGPLDYGLWDRTLMEVDLQLDSEVSYTRNIFRPFDLIALIGFH